MNRDVCFAIALCFSIQSLGCGQAIVELARHVTQTAADRTFTITKQPIRKPRAGTWLSTSSVGALSGRHAHSAVWTGIEMIAWGGYGPTCQGGAEGYCGDGAKYNPATDTWTATTSQNAPVRRSNHAAVWTGSLVLIWGGLGSGFLTDGSRYNPSTDSWAPMAATDAPPSSNGNAVWTGSEMIVWDDVQQPLSNQGGRYNPLTDTWVATSTVDAPAARVYHSVVWTGHEMIVWGGQNNSETLSSGGRYDPNTDSWQPTSLVNAPAQRTLHTAVWTGSAMIIWGGDAGLCCWSAATQFLGTGGIYDPNSDSWMPVATRRAPSARAFHSAIWTGSRLLVWGGATSCIPDPNAPLASGICSFTSTGGLFDPRNGNWRDTSVLNAPDGRFYPSTVWTGDEVIIWGGSNVTSNFFQTGGRYFP